ncbi:hypothetical protein N784_16530 [Pontibacillus litoralis JSM 072002]|uniref:SGNH hydrolase-type esterase domain-containing protein n=1 Tax=Pontibacillus litoralis JSM 072002 TaxID=1385512 RepID=A0A0A5G7T4_9BACI|nr:hypothetical protein N784_16530 [Pontibacillus litoralis JSM 072002]
MVAIGDSLTQGVGDESKNGGYVGALEQTLKEHEAVQNISIKSFGKRGNRTDQLLKRLEEQLDIQSAISKADVIIVTIGANDIMKVAKNNFTNLQYEAFANEQDEYEKRLRSIFSQLNAFNPNAMVYLIGLYNPFQEYFSDIPELDQIMNDWNNVGQRVTNEFPNAQFIPIRDIFENANQPLYAEDHFHPNKIAYQLIATRVLHYLQQDLIPLEERG